jgi:hypothetical protein
LRIFGYTQSEKQHKDRENMGHVPTQAEEVHRHGQTVFRQSILIRPFVLLAVVTTASAVAAEARTKDRFNPAELAKNFYFRAVNAVVHYFIVVVFNKNGPSIIALLQYY